MLVCFSFHIPYELRLVSKNEVASTCYIYHLRKLVSNTASCSAKDLFLKKQCSKIFDQKIKLFSFGL